MQNLDCRRYVLAKLAIDECAIGTHILDVENENRIKRTNWQRLGHGVSLIKVLFRSVSSI